MNLTPMIQSRIDTLSLSSYKPARERDKVPGGQVRGTIMTIDNAKFRKPVIPGDTVEYHVRKIRRRANIWRFACEALVEGAKVAEAEVTAMMVEA